MEQNIFIEKIHALLSECPPEAAQPWYDFAVERVDQQQYVNFKAAESRDESVAEWLDALYEGLRQIKESFGPELAAKVAALGIIETYDAASIIVAADEAAKTAIVDLIELRLARGMCGKSYLFLTGEVAAVEAAIERAKGAVAAEGMYLDSSVIASPDEQIRQAIL